MRPLLCILAVAAPKVNCLSACTTFAHLCICVNSQQTDSVICMQMFSLCWISTRHPSPKTCTMLARLNAGVTRRAAKPTPVHTPVGWCQDGWRLSLRSRLQGNAECWRVAQAQVVTAQLQLNQEASEWSHRNSWARAGWVVKCASERGEDLWVAVAGKLCAFVEVVCVWSQTSQKCLNLFIFSAWSWWCLGSLFFLL